MRTGVAKPGAKGTAPGSGEWAIGRDATQNVRLLSRGCRATLLVPTGPAEHIRFYQMSSVVKKYKFKAGANLQIEVVPLPTLTATLKQHLVTPHRTDFYHVFLLGNCSPTHLVDFEPVRLRSHSLLCIDSDRIHQFDQLRQYEGSVLIFTEDFFCVSVSDTKFLRTTILFNDLTDTADFQPEAGVMARLKAICAEIDDELRQPTDSAQHSLIQNLLHNFLLIADREKRRQGFSELKKGPDLDYTLLFRDLLEQDFVTAKTVGAYAGKLHVSAKRLGQATARVLGKTPKQLIDERVLLAAKRLLVHGSESIKEVGFQIGFDEPTNFIKYFRKHTGKTPVEFRESHLTQPAAAARAGQPKSIA